MSITSLSMYLSSRTVTRKVSVFETILLIALPFLLLLLQEIDRPGTVPSRYEEDVVRGCGVQQLLAGVSSTPGSCTLLRRHPRHRTSTGTVRRLRVMQARRPGSAVGTLHLARSFQAWAFLLLTGLPSQASFHGSCGANFEARVYL